MGDTISIKNPQNNLINQHTRASRYDSTAEFRLKHKTQSVKQLRKYLFLTAYVLSTNTIAATSLNKTYVNKDSKMVLYLSFQIEVSFTCQWNQ